MTVTFFLHCVIASRQAKQSRIYRRKVQKNPLFKQFVQINFQSADSSHKCSSLREVLGAMLGLSGKTKHFKLENLPYRTTLSDANRRRVSDLFCDIYNDLLKKYSPLISDSRIKEVIKKQVKIFDSTTISLFQDILKCTGRMPTDGKRKGGIKMHTVINVDEAVPKVVWFTEASCLLLKFIFTLPR
jgi:hypothetical protein